MLNRMSKRHCHVDLRTSRHSIPVTGLWKQVGVDLIGPLPVTAANRLYMITLSDFYSKWPETKAVPDKTAASTSYFITDVMMRSGCTDISSLTTNGGSMYEVNGRHV
ncbi:uncharacterized protein [Apostichopus japonicus]|uniref:uncharacterized protein n=1 Tax=Stichopus japonicus TaxID=307972 RepID=UPI003AB75F67